MGFYIKLGLRNIGRSRLRSALTILAVILCSTGIILYGTLMNGVMKTFLEGIISQTGHVRLIHPKLAKNERLGRGYYFVNNLDKLTTQLKKTKGVQYVAPRIDVGAFMDHEFKPKQEQDALASKRCSYKKKHLTLDKTDKISKKGTITKQAPGIGLGILPSAENATQQHDKKIALGRHVKEKGKEIVLGMEIAKRLRACLGSKITLMSQTVFGSPSGITLKVVGIINFGNALQNKMFLISLNTAQYLSELPNQASAVLVYGRNMWDSEPILHALKQQKWPTPLSFRKWQSDPLAKQSLPVMSVIMYVLSGFVIFIGGIGLLNAMMMSIMERQKEVGIMMALGLPPRAIAQIFLIEGVVYGLIGGVLGALIGSLASIPMVTKGITFGVEATAKMPLPIASTIKGTLTIEGVLIGLFVGIFATVFGSLWPAYKASQLDPVEVLRK